jgi:hypothetical protein
LALPGMGVGQSHSAGADGDAGGECEVTHRLTKNAVSHQVIHR